MFSWGKPRTEVRSVDLDCQGTALRDRQIPTFGPKLEFVFHIITLNAAERQRTEQSHRPFRPSVSYPRILILNSSSISYRSSASSWRGKIRVEPRCVS